MSRERARPDQGSAPDDADERVRPDERRLRDQGFVLAWLALMLVLLVGFAGFAVDLGHWYLTASRAQNAADASALGGVVFLPDELSEAEQVAWDLAEGHGYPSDDVNVAPGERPNQLEVSVTKEVDNFFVGIFGIDTTTITRSAMAEFEGPVPMGSPENFLGNDPELGESPDHWMNLASVRNNAVNGDRFAAGLCPGGGALGPCGSPSPAIDNPSYDPNGHIFAIEVAPGTPGPLRVDVFDPAFYEVGDTCTTNQGGVFNTDTGDLQAHAAGSSDIPDDWYDDADSRFVGGPSPTWCPGDHRAGASGGSEPLVSTFIVRSPDNSPWIDTDNPVVNTATCHPRQFEGRDNGWLSGDGGLQGKLTDPDEGRVTFPPGAWEQTVANSFRRWVTVCEIPNPEPGRYLLQVKSNAPLGNPLATDTTIDTWGHNRFSLRVGNGAPSDPGWNSGVRLFGNGRLPIYVNASGADTEFFLARVTPSTTQRLLNISLWDISDGGSSGSMRVVPPPDSGLSTFSDCSFGSSGGSYAPSPGDCSFSFGAGALNGELMQVEIPLPDGYSCDESNPFGCWIKVEAPFTGHVNDTTTWSADIVGDPVRLVE
ncbi:MAG: pilus assembly protein TadG-related protein [Acidimicrobiales bacterium]